MATRPTAGVDGAHEVVEAPDDPALADFPAQAPDTRRWCFADQLGAHFLDAPDQPVLLVESRAVFRRRRFHRQKAHLVLSALRHRAAELGDQDRKSTRLNSSHANISYAVFCLKKKIKNNKNR